MNNQLFGYLLIVVIMAGCTSDTVLESYFSFPGEQWKRFENPEIEFDITGPGIFYNMWLEADYDVSLAPDVLAITVIMYTPSGEIRSRDLKLEFKDVDENSRPGRLRVMLRKDFAFAEKGLCSFEFENRSQNVITPGMKRLGIILEKD
ncbi:MAG: hypothetical protein KAJ50_03480 [Bacteroidales bacterium]|nr:hypothetical protein [Bacteroidales bacterium]